MYQLVTDGGEEEEAYIKVRFFDDTVRRDGIGAGGEGVGGLFVEMGEVEEKEGVWEAKNRETHLCGEELYSASWQFAKGLIDSSLAGPLARDRERWWEVRYDVKGPKKDYVSTTRYERVQDSA